MTGPKILIVDDSAIQREIIRQAVAARGYDVIVADSGLSGIASVFEAHPDLIVSDVVMPEISGYHLCRFIKNEPALRDIPVVLMTSSAVNKKDRFWGMKSGADAYITKSSDAAPLMEAIKKLVPDELGATKEKAKSDFKVENIKSYLNYLFDKLLFETTLINEVRGLGEQVHEREKLLAEFTGLIDSLVEFVALGISLFDNAGTDTTIHCRQRLGRVGMRSIKRALSSRSNPAGDVAETLKFVPEELYDAGHLELGSPPCFSFDLVSNGELIGLITLVPVDSVLDDEVRHNIALAVREFGAVLRTNMYYEETRRLSISDGLTGLFNYRHFLSGVDQEFKRFQRYQSPLSVIMLDLDGFKQINDVHGHPAGDKLLRAAAKVMTKSVRDVDLLARYGGDEFVILLPETEQEGAETVGERIRANIEALVVDFAGAHLGVTASVGVSTVTPACERFSDLIGAADKALYMSKEAGRNQVTISLFES